MFTIFFNFDKSGILSGVFSVVRPHRKDEWPWPWWFKSFKTAIFLTRCHNSFCSSLLSMKIEKELIYFYTYKLAFKNQRNTKNKGMHDQ